jgi:flavin reductase (DIM6/NTAB) family NADH-FMN oxidoreductase RutF
VTGLLKALRQRIGPLPQWSPIALNQPQEAVQVRLLSPDGEFDVTRAAVVASLRPLTLAIGLDEKLQSAVGKHSSARLHLVDLDTRGTVGMLDLSHVRNWETSGITLGLFEIRHGEHHCARWPLREWNRWQQNRVMRRNSDPHNFVMPADAVQQQMIFYICPRPVVIVSVDDGQHSNLFPMDLIGPVSPERFALALRSTSQSVPTMKSARRIAISDVPAPDYKIAYKLGVHHKNVQVDWDHLPFKLQRSHEFQLRCPQSTPRIREIEILDFDTIGSHTVFISRVASEQAAGADALFFHTSGIYQHYRSRNGRPFPSANVTTASAPASTNG